MPGSYVALTHPTLELDGEGNVAAMAFWNENASQPIVARSGAVVARFLDGLELVEPGLVSCALWRPAEVDVGKSHAVPQWGAVAVKR